MPVRIDSTFWKDLVYTSGPDELKYLEGTHITHMCNLRWKNDAVDISQQRITCPQITLQDKSRRENEDIFRLDYEGYGSNATCRDVWMKDSIQLPTNTYWHLKGSVQESPNSGYRCACIVLQFPFNEDPNARRLKEVQLRFPISSKKESDLVSLWWLALNDARVRSRGTKEDEVLRRRN